MDSDGAAVLSSPFWVAEDVRQSNAAEAPLFAVREHCSADQRRRLTQAEEAQQLLRERELCDVSKGCVKHELGCS